MTCAHCNGALAALHHGGQHEYVHLLCGSCGAHLYGATAAPRWWTRREWSSWIEETTEAEVAA